MQGCCGGFGVWVGGGWGGGLWLEWCVVGWAGELASGGRMGFVIYSSIVVGKGTDRAGAR